MPLSFSIACALIALAGALAAFISGLRAWRTARRAERHYYAALAEMCKLLSYGIDLASRVDEDEPISPALADWARASRRFIEISRAWQASR
jgi:hypothetical protein